MARRDCRSWAWAGSMDCPETGKAVPLGLRRVPVSAACRGVIYGTEASGESSISSPPKEKEKDCAILRLVSRRGSRSRLLNSLSTYVKPSVHVGRCWSHERKNLVTW